MRIPWSKYKKILGRKQGKNIVGSLFKRARIHWWLTGIVFIFITAWLVFPSEYRQKFVNPNDFKLGEKSTKDVFASVSVNYQEIIETDAERQKILAEVPPVFNLDFQGLKKAEEQFEIVHRVQKDPILSKTQKIEQIRDLFYIGPSDKVGFILAEASDEQIKSMKEETLRIFSDVLSRGVIADSDDASLAHELAKINYLRPKWDIVKEEIEKQTGTTATDAQIAARMNVTLVDNRLGSVSERTLSVKEMLTWSEARIVAKNMANELPEPISDVVKDMLELMRPNLTYNPALTKDNQERQINGLLSSNHKIEKDDKVIGIGELVTESHIRKLKALSAAQKQVMLHSLPSVILLVLLLSVLFIIYIEKQEPSLFLKPRKILAVSAVMLLTFALSNLIINQVPKLGLQSPGLLIPVALAAIIIAVITNVQLSILSACIMGVLISVLSGIGTVNSFEYFLVTLTGSTVAAIYVSHTRRRRHLINVGLYVSFTNVVTILGVGLLADEPLIKVGTGCLIGAINGLIVALLTPGLLPVFEYLSRTTTDMELLELSDLNQPLLIQLKEKASGSYYHSLDVAKLAETAAEAIKANPLLARVGSYYHDIGKMAKPEYFIENQKGENVHDKLNPSMSSRVISSHVKDGVKMVKDARLPQVIQEIVQQHHGNTMIGGLRFYQKAMEADRHNAVRLEDYRYPGPKPQTKEAAIILLADSVESARHVLLRDDPSYSRIINFVREIIEDKTMDSQLDECDLTLKDISLISDAFVKVLSGMYHTRIEYLKEAEMVSVGTEHE
jgi:putative nucleotidyltransferase with HDIG domain